MLRGGNGGRLAAIDRHAELGNVIFDNFEFYKVAVFLLVETGDVFEHIGERCDFFVIEQRVFRRPLKSLFRRRDPWQ